VNPEGLRSGIEALIAGVLRRHVVEQVLARTELVTALGPQAIERIRREVMNHLARQEKEGEASLADLERKVVELFGEPGQIAWDCVTGKVPPVTKDEEEGA